MNGATPKKSHFDVSFAPGFIDAGKYGFPQTLVFSLIQIVILYFDTLKYTMTRYLRIRLSPHGWRQPGETCPIQELMNLL